MNKQDYQKKLLMLIEELKADKIKPQGFIKEAQLLGKELDKNGYTKISDFEDQDFGWAKYWIEETDYFGVEVVMKSYFDFYKLLKKKI